MFTFDKPDLHSFVIGNELVIIFSSLITNYRAGWHSYRRRSLHPPFFHEVEEFRTFDMSTFNGSGRREKVGGTGLLLKSSRILEDP